MKILNLYAGIGGNRRLWGDDHEITAVEYDERIAVIYQSLYTNDKVITGDAHQYLLDHYQEFDFIWASPPCPSHSRVNYFLNKRGTIRYPDMSLYQEILFLQSFFKGKYSVENVIPYYKPLIPAQESGRHLFWANSKIPNLNSRITIPGMNSKRKNKGNVTTHQLEKDIFKKMGFPDLSNYKYPDKHNLLRNCVDPEIGLAILNAATGSFKQQKVKQVNLFF